MRRGGEVEPTRHCLFGAVMSPSKLFQKAVCCYAYCFSQVENQYQSFDQGKEIIPNLVLKARINLRCSDDQFVQ